jgi:hypothetical protein
MAYLKDTLAGKSSNTSKRLVRVLVVDLDSNVPADKSVIHDEEMFTDLSNSGIVMSLRLKELLDEYNSEVRTKLTKETEEGKLLPLKPLHLNDVNVSIINIHSF